MNRNKTIGLSLLLFALIVGSVFMLYTQPSSVEHTIEEQTSNKDEDIKRIYGSYIDIVARQVESRIGSIFNELAILRDIAQTYIDNGEELMAITDAMKANPYTTDKLTFNGKWYQNTPDEPNVVMVHRHLLEDDGQIKEEVQRDIDNTLLLDLVLPSFHKNGVKKQLTYAQGGMDKSFTRMSPWVDLGTLFYEVYPAFIDTSIWQAFNPGLVPAFEKRMKEEPEVQADPNKLARVLLPVQDGVTGEIVTTFTSPLFDEQREQFRGTVAFDVTMTDLIDIIEGLNFSDKGFSFLSQSSGNIFAVNEEGAEILGFEEALDSLEVTGKGVGFNRLERTLEKSQFEDIQNLELPTGGIAVYENVNLDGLKYTIIMQQLKPFQIWVSDEWFKDESWIVGLVIPEDEFETAIDQQVKNEENPNQGYLMYFAMIVISAALMMLLVIRSSKTVNSHGNGGM